MLDDPTFLQICQLNTNKSNDAQSALLQNIGEFDIVTIQEPHIDFLKNTRVSHDWVVVYPTGHKDNDDMSRSITLINKRLSTNCWTQVPVNCPDITAITIRTNTNTVHLFNVYNPQENDSVLKTLANATRRLQRDDDLYGGEDTDQIIWLGDFNRHHPLWDDERNTHLFTEEYLDRAQALIDLLSSFDLHMLLPEGIPTLEASNTKNLTRPDNVFASERLAECLVTCKVAPELRPPRTDHFPIVTTLQLDVPHAPRRKRRNFRRVVWSEFRTALAMRLEELKDPREILDTTEKFTTALSGLLTALTETDEQYRHL